MYFDDCCNNEFIKDLQRDKSVIPIDIPNGYRICLVPDNYTSLMIPEPVVESVQLLDNESDSKYDRMFKTLKLRLSLPGQYDEGTDDYRDRVKTGTTRNYLTYPGVVQLEQASPHAGYGKLSWTYGCREERKHYLSSVHRDTTHHQHPGMLTAEWMFTVKDTVVFENIQVHGLAGRCADSIVRLLRDIQASQINLND
ncbi:hypothetical protein [Paraclostridium dentum]|uniref:hypothetical protein n=1 Tax=Paraclostridium dentum TaxID=2662455 RepID=UPI0014753C19|nr:hypothetical protein [Paraclostridium dentum]